MNIRLILGNAAVVAALVLLSPAAAPAQNISQYSNIYQRPTVSPYLNLLNNNQFGISTYQTTVRPQIEEREAIQRNAASLQALQQQFQQGQQALPYSGRGGGRYGSSTGHPTRFMNYSHYYNLRGR
jgi:hypothetical protein